MNATKLKYARERIQMIIAEQRKKAMRSIDFRWKILTPKDRIKALRNGEFQIKKNAEKWVGGMTADEERKFEDRLRKSWNAVVDLGALERAFRGDDIGLVISFNDEEENEECYAHNKLEEIREEYRQKEVEIMDELMLGDEEQALRMIKELEQGKR